MRFSATFGDNRRNHSGHGNPAHLQEELFRAYGTPAQDKRQRIFENSGHWPLPMNEVIRETVDWLDRYLGPVAAR